MQEWFRLQAERALTGSAACGCETPPGRGALRYGCDRTRSAIALTKALADARAPAQSGDRLDGAHQRSGLVNEPEMISDVARRSPTRNGATVHRPAARARHAIATPVDDDGAPMEVGHLRSHAGRGDRLHHRRRAGGEVAALQRADPRERGDDASREGHPLRI